MPILLGMINLNEVIPYVILWIPWFISLYGIYSGLKHGVMREYRRNEYTELGDSDRPNRYSYRNTQPISFWALFVFQIIILILVPIGTYFGIKHRLKTLREDAQQNENVHLYHTNNHTICITPRRVEGVNPLVTR